MRVAAWASASLYLVADVIWAWTSWHSTRGTASAFATDLTGLALWGSLLVLFVVMRRLRRPPNVHLVLIVLCSLVALLSAAQVVLDLTHRR